MVQIAESGQKNTAAAEAAMGSSISHGAEWLWLTLAMPLPAVGALFQ
jgi:hypothetical protein